MTRWPKGKSSRRQSNPKLKSNSHSARCSFFVTILGFPPKGMQLVAGDKQSAITGTQVLETHPETMPAAVCLTSPSGCDDLLMFTGGVRCARPPATCWHPFRVKLPGAAASKTFIGPSFIIGLRAARTLAIDQGTISLRTWPQSSKRYDRRSQNCCSSRT